MTTKKKLLALASMFTFVACAAPSTTEDEEASPNVGGSNDEINQGAPQYQSCAFDPSSGKPNLFGQRAFVTMFEQKGLVVVRFEQFPSPAGAPGSGLEATLAQRRDVTLHQSDLAKAKETLRREPKLWDALFDGDNKTTFAQWEENAKCQAAPTPKLAPLQPTCAYDPESGKPNPLGMRSYFTLVKTENRVDGIYDQFPSNLGATVPATVSTRRTLSIHKTTDIAAVRSALKDEATGLSKAIFGAEMASVMAKIDETFKCQ